VKASPLIETKQINNMKIIYVNNLRRKVQQGLSFALESTNGSIKVGDSVDPSRLWSDLPKSKEGRTVTAIAIEDWVLYAAISGKTISKLY
jgi:hypothetical protein